MNATITLPQALIKRLEKLSATSRLKPETLVSEAIKERLDYEEWKIKKVHASLASVKAGKVYSKDEFWTQLAKARNERKKAA